MDGALERRNVRVRREANRNLSLFALARVFVRFDHVARFIVKTRPKVNRDFQKPICLAKPARFLVKLCAL
jgi:hypothetical protein